MALNDAFAAVRAVSAACGVVLVLHVIDVSKRPKTVNTVYDCL